jgi:hypothetical protein
MNGQQMQLSPAHVDNGDLDEFTDNERISDGLLHLLPAVPR